MALFEVEVDGKVIKTFEAEDFWRKDGAFIFVDADNATVGTIITKPGMSVTKLSKPKGPIQQQYGR